MHTLPRRCLHKHLQVGVQRRRTQPCIHSHGWLQRCHFYVRFNGQQQDLHPGLLLPSPNHDIFLTRLQSCDDDQPGILPRTMKDVFAFIGRTPPRKYLLRCSYLEIYNDTIHDLLAPSSALPVQLQGSGTNVWLTRLHEKVVTSLAAVCAMIVRGWAARRTASTDRNDRSSRSHCVF